VICSRTVGLADFDRIDVVATDADGRERWIMVAGLGFPEEDEAAFIAQFLIKLARLEQHASHQEKPPLLELVSLDEPPMCVLEILRRRGHRAVVGVEERRPAGGRTCRFGLEYDGWPDIDALQQANAAAFAQAQGLLVPPDLDSLDALDDVLEERRREHGLDDDETDDDFLDGSLMVLAGAYAGEAIRAAIGGGWRFEPRIAMLQPIHLSTSDGSKVNVLGKVLKFLRGGSSDSVASLARVVVHQAREG
jgi:hypothetical protein